MYKMKGGIMINQKKAVSEIVSTVLIIMIAVAAVGIIAAIVVPMVRDNLQGGTACLNAMNDVSIATQAGLTCYKNNTDGNYTVNVQVRKGSDQTIELSGLRLIVEDTEGSSVSHIFNDTENEIPSIGETKMLQHNVTAQPRFVSIAPIVRVGNSDVSCDAPATPTTITECR